YLKGTINLGLWYPKDSGFDLTAYSDADHAGYHLDRKTESEYVAVSSCCAQVLWMRTQLTDYGFFCDKVPIYCDLKSTIAISCNLVQHTRTKHIDVRYHFIKDHVEKGTIELYFVGTEYQLADLFTKSLPEARFKFLVEKLATGTEEEQAKNFQWGLRKSTLTTSCVCRLRMWPRQKSGDRHQSTSQQSSHRNHDQNNDRHGSNRGVTRETGVSCPTDLPILVANAARNYEILDERDDDDTERPDKRQRSGDRHQLTSQQSSHRSHGYSNDCHGSDRRGIPVMDGTRETGVISLTDLPILVLSNPGVLFRVTPTQFALLVDVDTKESVIELQVRGGAGEELSVANATRNYEILHARDDEDTEQPDKRQRSGDRHQPTSQQSSHRSHGHNNDRHGSDRRGGSDNHRSSNSNYSGSNNMNSGYGRDQRNRGHQSDRYANSGSQQSRGPSEGYSYPACTTCGRRHPGECRRAAGTCFKCGQAGHLQKDCKKNTTASTSGQADKKPGVSGRVFAITEGHAANTSGTITGTLFIYGHAVFVLFDTGATRSVISSAFASRVTTTPTLLDHLLCISTPMQDFVRITHVYRNLPLQFDDKIRAINALPLDMCEFDLILASVKEIDYIQLETVNQAELKLQPRAFFSFCTAAYTEMKILPNLLRT
nr:Gag-Pol polyprotein [Tanacetum cinerariifolium]